MSRSGARASGDGSWPAPGWLVRLHALIEEGWRFQRELRGLANPKPFRRSTRPCENALVPAAPASGSRPLVSLIVLNRDSEDLLEALFESFHRVNTYPRVELILVDHGSRDGSIAVAERWGGMLPISIVRSPVNHSFSYSCNRAAERAAGEIVVLLNNDILFTEDVLGRMVDTVEAEGGIVGIKLFGTVESGAPYHIGVRPCWNPGHRVVGAFNSTELAGDARVGWAPARMPAVTGAILMCRRADYLRLGGLYEQYLYGYEDVDFCQKARLGGLPITCLNDLSAVHREGTTRFAIIGWTHRRIWHRQNIAAFNRRFGYGLRREMMARLFDDDGSFLGRRPNVAIAVPPGGSGRFAALAASLDSVLGWQVRFLEGAARYDLRGADLLVVADPAWRLDLARHRIPMLSSVVWLEGDGETRPDLGCFDLVLADRPRPDLDMPVAVLDPGTPGAAAALASRLGAYWREAHRFCLLGSSGDAGLADALALRLRAAGHFVRILTARAWRNRDGMRDEVLVHLGGDAAPAPARINLTVAPRTTVIPAGMDAVLTPGSPDDLARAILDTADRSRALRSAPPEDPPLVSAGDAIGDAVHGWRAHPDPMYGLLAASGRG